MADLKPSAAGPEPIGARVPAQELPRLGPNPTKEAAPSPEAQRLGFEKKALRAALGLERKEAPEPKPPKGGGLRGVNLDIFI
ncbi:MAG: hypothetical protein ACE5LX_00290 [Nitrospinota bacterium]